MSLRILKNDKFSTLAFTGASVIAFDGELEVTGGLWAKTKPPVDVDKWWHERLGSLRAEEVAKANFWLIGKKRSANPDVIDQDDKDLRAAVNTLFHALLVVGPPVYQHAYLLTGANTDGAPAVRSFGEAQQYLLSRGARDFVVDKTVLRSAERVRAGLVGAFANPRSMRLRKGLHSFWRGLKESAPQDRLHQFVRAAESIVKPRRAGTAVDFAERCRTFTAGNPAVDPIIRECYDLLSATEHMRDELEVLRQKGYPAGQREEIFYLRVRQMEALARHVLLRILTSHALVQEFEEQQIDNFWGKSEASRWRAWGGRANLLLVR